MATLSDLIHNLQNKENINNQKKKKNICISERQFSMTITLGKKKSVWLNAVCSKMTTGTVLNGLLNKKDWTHEKLFSQKISNPHM